jgi:hypothetical protein
MKMVVRIVRGSAAALLLAGVLLPPAALVAAGLPAAYRAYAAGYVQGLWVLKALLAAGGLAGLLWPRAVAGLWAAEALVPADAAGWERRDTVAVAALAAAALALRLVELGRSFTFDEAFLMQAVIVDNPLRIVLHPSGSTHALNSLLAAGLIRLGGASEWAVRLPAVAAGAAAPALLFVAVRRTCVSAGASPTEQPVRSPGCTSAADPRLRRGFAALAGAWLAVTPFHIWYSQEAKGNAALATCVLLAWCLLLRRTWRPVHAAAYGVTLLLAGLAHLSGVLTLLLLGAAVSLVPGLPAGRRRRALGLHALALWGVLLFYAPVLPFLAGHRQTVTQREGAVGLLELLRQIVQQWTVLDRPTGLALIVGLLALPGGLWLWRRARPLVVLAIVPLAGSVALTAAAGVFSFPRYHMACLPGFVLLLAAGAWALGAAAAGRSTARVGARVAAGLLLAGAMGVAVWGYGGALRTYYRWPKSAYQAVGRLLTADPAPLTYVVGKDRLGYPASALGYYVDRFDTDATVAAALAPLDAESRVRVVVLDPLAFATAYPALAASLPPAAESTVRLPCLGELDQYRVREALLYGLRAGRLRALPGLTP